MRPLAFAQGTEVGCGLIDVDSVMDALLQILTDRFRVTKNGSDKSNSTSRGRRKRKVPGERGASRMATEQKPRGKAGLRDSPQG